jgi:3-methylcrotonyl-CoA carboxylase beta subunit
MDEVVEKLKELRSTISQGGTAKAREKHIKRGKMLPREYV